MSEDGLNENLLRHLKISPQLLEICADDPEQLAKLHRIQRALLAEKATRKCLSDPNVTPQQIAAVIESLRKAEATNGTNGPNGGGSQFYFAITLPNSGKSLSIDTRQPIEGNAEPA